MTLPNLPNLPELPITEVIDALRSALLENCNLVLVAPPGAGKTTLVPLALLDAPWRNGRKIIVLEPRRLAARAAANTHGIPVVGTGGWHGWISYPL